MKISSFAVAANILAVAYATPANLLFARHKECEYSGIKGGVTHTGTCNKAGNNGAGTCTFPGLSGSYGCDYQWKNDASMSPCGNAANSQFACKKNGDPCYAYAYAENSNDAVIHCTNR
ncbi:hypothetical protein F4821DRAFT_256774 [Hypoxylon rubiginosum]|uniref:Uncharacterized protein n=1 Tax=Hypoxylon rubiginosum TaxID=110542 RepID=A0ACC0DAW4_9PEZI|nr:hypothetical protein F4821DRAFT_256774 [Hypoxylon rubiginosum]